MSDTQRLELLKTRVLEQQRLIEEMKQTIAKQNALLHMSRVDSEQVEFQLRQNQDLIFAMMHTFGPKINIKIENFRSTMQEAQMLGGIGVTDDDLFHCALEFYPEGIPEDKLPRTNNKPETNTDK